MKHWNIETSTYITSRRSHPMELLFVCGDQWFFGWVITSLQFCVNMWTSSTSIHFMVHHLWMLFLFFSGCVLVAKKEPFCVAWHTLKVPLMDKSLQKIESRLIKTYVRIDAGYLRYQLVGCFRLLTILHCVDYLKTYDTTLQNQEIDSKKHWILALYVWSGSFYLMRQESKGAEDPPTSLQGRFSRFDMSTVMIWRAHMRNHLVCVGSPPCRFDLFFWK